MKRCPKCSASVPLLDRKDARLGRPGDVGALVSRSPSKRSSKSKLSHEAKELLDIMRGEAIALSDIGRVLKKSRGAVNAHDETFGWSPVLFAAHLGDAGLIMFLIDHKADIKACCAQGNAALHLASRGNHLEAVDFLLHKKADIEAQNVHGWTPLAWSAIAGCAQVAMMLLQGSAEVDVPDTGGRTPCMWAARHGHEGIVRLLLSSSVDILRKDEAGQTLKEHVDFYRNTRRSTGLMPPTSPSHKQLGHLVEDDSPYLGTAHGMPDLRRLSQQYSAKPLAVERPVTTPGTRRDMQLVSSPAPCEAIYEIFTMSSKMMVACEEGKWDTAIELIKKSACIGTRGQPHHRTPLMCAAFHSAPNAALIFAEMKCPVEARDVFGWTALHHAVHVGSSEMVSTLHHLGANFGASTDAGDTVGHLAARADAAAMLQLMSPAMIPNARDVHGHTPLQAAAQTGCVNATRTLIALSADPEIKDKKHRTVFLLCAASGHRAVAEALLEPLQPLKALWTEEQIMDRAKKLNFSKTSSLRANTAPAFQSKFRPGGARGNLLEVPQASRGGAKHKSKPRPKRPSTFVLLEEVSEAPEERPFTAPTVELIMKLQEVQETADDVPVTEEREVEAPVSAGTLVERSVAETAEEGALRADEEAWPARPSKAVPVVALQLPPEEDRVVPPAEGEDDYEEDEPAPLAEEEEEEGDELASAAEYGEEEEEAEEEARSHEASSMLEGSLSARSRTSELSEGHDSGLSDISEQSRNTIASFASGVTKADGNKSRSLRRQASRESCRSLRSAADSAVGSRASNGSNRSKGSKAPDRGRRRKKADVPDTPLGLMMVATKVEEPHAIEVPVSRGKALGARDIDGRNALGVAAQMQKPDMVCFLLKMKVDMNLRDTLGNTPLMLAAALGDRATVMHLMDARAQVDVLNNDGKRASEVGPNADLRRTLQLEVDRLSVEKRMNRWASLQPLAKNGQMSAPAAKGRCRLRLDGLPTGQPVEFLERLVRRALQDCSIDSHSHMEVVVDPFTHLPRGHAFIDFPDSAKAAAAGEIMREEAHLLVTSPTG